MPKISTVEFSGVAVSGSGYLAHPGTGLHGIIVLQEWWGLVPHIEDVARRVADQGYIAVAPYLYQGKMTVEEAEKVQADAAAQVQASSAAKNQSEDEQ